MRANTLMRGLCRAVSNGHRERASLQHEGAPLLVCGDLLHRDKDRLDPEEAHLHPDVLRLTVPVQKQPLGAAYLLPSWVTNRVPRVFLEGRARTAGFLTIYRRVWCAHGQAPFFGLIAALRKTLGRRSPQCSLADLPRP